MEQRSLLGRARGLGSAKEGIGHWWAERLSALALVPLSIWFAASIAGHAGADYEAMRAWVSSPLVAGLLVLLIVMTFYHGALGLQVILEDYVHHKGIRLASLLLVRGGALLLAVIALVSVLSILFGG